MNQIHDDGKCRHTGCECTEIGADEYCSAGCRIAEENGKPGACTCGHAECSMTEG